MIKKLLLSIWLVFILAQFILAQDVADTAFIAKAVANAKKTQYRNQSLQSHLFNGVFYVEPRITHVDKFPQYLSNEWSAGSVQYDGESFDGVGILYDIFSDDLVIEMPSSGSAVKLIKEKIKTFTVNNLQFVNIATGAPRSGFYGKLYDGTIEAYVRFEKSKQERIDNGVLTIDYEQKNRYYIVKNGVFHSIGSKGDVYKVLGDKKSELKQFARKEKIQFRKNKQQSITKLVTYYDTI